MLQALIDRVATEPGFPSYADYHPAPGLYGPSGFGRACGRVRVRVRVRTLTLTLTLTLILTLTLTVTEALTLAKARLRRGGVPAGPRY